ncbi:uncharacterized protein LOC111622385 [Centruroides sculpturatus]|uniref:uncharacterized protein LOC111622385 n=1 Tax=Centruroides sculpturatus TaxID=218467 RepID=UPI000C6E129B|nr:uncharacterized protein LOC111622385 [Centruroides sculpturatus]
MCGDENISRRRKWCHHSSFLLCLKISQIIFLLIAISEVISGIVHLLLKLDSGFVQLIIGNIFLLNFILLRCITFRISQSRNELVEEIVPTAQISRQSSFTYLELSVFSGIGERVAEFSDTRYVETDHRTLQSSLVFERNRENDVELPSISNQICQNYLELPSTSSQIPQNYPESASTSSQISRSSLESPLMSGQTFPEYSKLLPTTSQIFGNFFEYHHHPAKLLKTTWYYHYNPATLSKTVWNSHQHPARLTKVVTNYVNQPAKISSVICKYHYSPAKMHQSKWKCHLHPAKSPKISH